jgi:4-hydroxy-tetrahydrodipicolinate synthase
VFQGSLVALVTPFGRDNQVDYGSLKRLIDFHVDEGSNGLVIAGTTGEAATLTRSEHIKLVEQAVKFSAGRIPVIAGTGSNSTAQTVDLSQALLGAGIDAFLVVVPYYNKPTQEGIYQHFMVVANALDKPVMMYNVPGRTVADMQPETVARLSKNKNILGIKEATGDLQRLQAIQDLVDDNFKLFSGDDFTLLPFIEQGGHGVVTVSGNVAAKQVAKLCDLALKDQSEAAKKLDDSLQALNRALFVESNPIPVKWAVSQMGLMEENIRLPLTPYESQFHNQMREAMRLAGVLSEENA